MAIEVYFCKVVIVLYWIGCAGLVSGLCCQRCYDAFKQDTGRWH